VPENLRETIFNPAFTTKGVGDGTGLGLTIALSTLRQIGGDLRLARETEGGAEFQILLRLSDTDIDHSATPDLQGHDYCVLYVEDNDLVRENTVSMLKQIGTRPLVARNSREALEIAKENSAIDIVLTDLVLPGGMSGRALSKQVKHILPEVPVIITTGYYPEEPTSEPPETAYLRKPYTQDQLVEILAGALQRTRPS
jgi:CheY-like chemotaxis protein